MPDTSERATSHGYLDVAVWVSLAAVFGSIGAHGVEHGLRGPMLIGGFGLLLSVFFLLQPYLSSEVLER